MDLSPITNIGYECLCYSPAYDTPVRLPGSKGKWVIYAGHAEKVFIASSADPLKCVAKILYAIEHQDEAKEIPHTEL